MTRVGKKPLAVVAGLLLLLTYLLIESRSPNQAQQARLQEALQAIQLHDAELNRDVLMARAGLLPHYDSLPRLGQSLRRDLETLRTESATLADAHATPIGQEVEALAAALTQKLTQVEYLKTDNALLRNSLAYFTHSIQTLDRAGNPEQLDIASLSHIMLQFVQTPEAGVRKEIEAALVRLANIPLDQQALKPLTLHGRLIVEVLPQLDTLLREIVAAPTTLHAEALQQAILEHAGNAEARAQRFRLLLYLVAVILLGYLLHQVARLRANARELRRKEIQLIQANKMTSLGTLVSGVAHEINNPNQAVLMNSAVLATVWDAAVGILDWHRQESGDFFLEGLPYSEMRATVPRLIREIHEGAQRIERIIGDLKDFARPGARGTSAAFPLNEVVQRALRLLAHPIQKRTDRFHVELAQGLPSLYGDAQQVEQIVVNLVINALEALPDRSRAVTVTTWFDAARRQVVLEVRDEGVGIPPEHIPHLGEPFFTTKEASGGTGLGLAIAASLVRLHQGRLAFASEPGQGTRARVEFPGHPDGQPPPAAAGSG